MNNALSEALKYWGKALPAGQSVDCQTVQAQGLNCLPGKASWKEIISMNRPVILEFTSGAEDKRYALMTGLKQSRSLVRLYNDMEFPLADILNHWNGYFLVVWKSPRPNMKIIALGQSSDHVLWLRQQLNTANGNQDSAVNSKYFDETLKKRVLDFQHRNHLLEDGIAGAQTLIYLDNITGSADSLHLKITD